MKHAICFLIMVLFSLSISAQQTAQNQESPKVDNFKVQLQGGVSIGSLHYERFFGQSKGFRLKSSIGLGYAKKFNLDLFSNNNNSDQGFISIPLSLTGLIGKTPHKLELGFGGSLVEESFFAYPVLGYKYLPKDDKKLNLNLVCNFRFSNWDGQYDSSIIGIGVGKMF